MTASFRQFIGVNNFIYFVNEPYSILHLSHIVKLSHFDKHSTSVLTLFRKVFSAMRLLFLHTFLHLILQGVDFKNIRIEHIRRKKA